MFVLMCVSPFSSNSDELLPGKEHKDVELMSVKKGTLIITPSPPPLPPEADNPPPSKTDDTSLSKNLTPPRVQMVYLLVIAMFELVVMLQYVLKEKLPQAFMQIMSMENDFRNLSAKVWENLDNPIKSYDFSNFWLISCMLPSRALCYNLWCHSSTTL